MGRRGEFLRINRQTSIPPIPGMLMSSSTTSNCAVPSCANISETSCPSTITVGRGKKSHLDEHKQDKYFFRRAAGPPAPGFPILKWSPVRIVVVSAPSIRLSIIDQPIQAKAPPAR